MTQRTISARTAATNPVRNPTFSAQSIPPRLLLQEPDLTDAQARRTKIWEFNAHLHCSIIGTCLTTMQLRQLLRKLGLAPEGSTDHDLHGVAVSLAARQEEPARRLHKALDHNHKLAVSQFGRVSTEPEVRTLWREAVKRGEIPGAYWATLTHQATSQALVREAFGDVHMLSHLVGAANRADIRRLCTLEAERAELARKLEEQAEAAHQAIAQRDRQINELRSVLVTPRAADTASPEPHWSARIEELQRRLDAETARRISLEQKLAGAQEDAKNNLKQRLQAEQAAQAAFAEREAVERSLQGTLHQSATAEAPGSFGLDGRLVLYAGGRPGQIPAMKAAVERLGGTLLHHDGGIEHHTNLLPGLISRADVVVFPVDCVSHEAVYAVKTHCQQADKVFLPLRSSGLTSLVAGLRGLFSPDLPDVAD